MPKRNYGFEKRQKELKRHRKKEEKQQRKVDRANARSEDPEGQGSSPAEPPPEE